jgi:NAD(P)-dependent dehydrogenase (short-subunit alcohol dehydrogenase family)
MTTTRFRNQAALVTGAGSGIGRETALLLASRGARLFLCDLNEKGLAETRRDAEARGSTVRTDIVDVSNRTSMQAYADAVHAEVEALDILVNNAGVGVGGGFLNTPLSDWDWVVGANLWGVVHGCHFFLPKMVARGRGGHLVNVASAAGYVATPDLAAYATTKFGVVGLTEALREELAPHGIGVSTICPGIINTPITRSSRMNGPEAAQRERIAAFYKKRNYGPEKVAAVIVDAIERNRALVPVTPEAWVLYALKRAVPGLLPVLGRRMRQRAMKDS